MRFLVQLIQDVTSHCRLITSKAESLFINLGREREEKRREEERISAEDQKSTDSVASVPSSSTSLRFQTPLSLPLLRY